MSDGGGQAATKVPASEPDVGSSPTHISNPKLRYEAQRALVWTGVIGLTVLTVYLSQSLLVIFAAMTFACMLDGGARLLGRLFEGLTRSLGRTRTIGRGWLITLTILLMVGFFVWLSWFAGSQISQQAAEFPRLANEQLGKVLVWLDARGFAVGQDQVRGLAANLFSGFGTVTSAIGGFIGGLASGFMIMIIGIYLAIDPRPYERGLAWMVPEGQRAVVSDTLSHMAFTMRRLLAGRLLGMVVEGVLTWAILAYGGLLLDYSGLWTGIGPVPMAALLGLITGLLAFIPNIGAIISGLLMVLIGFSGGTDMGLFTIGVYFFVQNFDGYFVVPLIAKKTVDLAPALVLGAQLITGVLFGILGLALADPILAMIKVALERRSHWIETNDKKPVGAKKAKARKRAPA